MIRAGTPQDAGRIAEINVASWRFAYHGLVDEEILYRDILIENWAKNFKSCLEENRDFVFVFEDENSKIIKAMMGLGGCNDTVKPTAYELHFLYVEPLYSRHGIGSEMVNFFESKGIGLGYTELIVWVLESNSIGINCYRKLGYAPDGQTKIYKRLNKNVVRYTKTIYTLKINGLIAHLMEVLEEMAFRMLNSPTTTSGIGVFPAV